MLLLAESQHQVENRVDNIGRTTESHGDEARREHDTRTYAETRCRIGLFAAGKTFERVAETPARKSLCTGKWVQIPQRSLGHVGAEATGSNATHGQDNFGVSEQSKNER